jgi:hypothetical protein
MMQRKDISKYIYKYFIEKDEKENFVLTLTCPQGSPTDNVKWSLLLGNRNYIMHCFFPHFV